MITRWRTVTLVLVTGVTLLWTPAIATGHQLTDPIEATPHTRISDDGEDCTPLCQNGGTCVGKDLCSCPHWTSGRTCSVILEDACKVAVNWENVIVKKKKKNLFVSCAPGYAVHNEPFKEWQLECKNGTFVDLPYLAWDEKHPCQPVCEPPCSQDSKCVAPGQCRKRKAEGKNTMLEKDEISSCGSLPTTGSNFTQQLFTDTYGQIRCNDGFLFPSGEQEINFTCIGKEWQFSGGMAGHDIIQCHPACNPPCLNHGVCVKPNKCDCTTGFTGNQCQFRTGVQTLEEQQESVSGSSKQQQQQINIPYPTLPWQNPKNNFVKQSLNNASSMETIKDELKTVPLSINKTEGQIKTEPYKRIIKEETKSEQTVSTVEPPGLRIHSLENESSPYELPRPYSGNSPHIADKSWGTCLGAGHPILPLKPITEPREKIENILSLDETEGKIKTEPYKKIIKETKSKQTVSTVEPPGLRIHSLENENSPYELSRPYLGNLPHIADKSWGTCLQRAVPLFKLENKPLVSIKTSIQRSEHNRKKKKVHYMNEKKQK